MPNIMLTQSIKAYFLGVRNISSQSYRDNWKDNQQFGGSFHTSHSLFRQLLFTVRNSATVLDMTVIGGYIKRCKFL